jgi:AraC-like DNA-binding protein
LTDPPFFLMDALSDLLHAMRLKGALFLEARFTAPWCVAGGCPASLCAHGAHIVFFHVVTHGRCRVRLNGGETHEMSAGDLILMPHNDRHVLGSDLHLAPVDAQALVRPAPPGGLHSIDHGGGGEETRLMCGYLSCDPALGRPLLDGLPRLLRVPLGKGPAARWLLGLVRRGAREHASPSPGSRTVLAKLAELLFAEAMRQYLESQPGERLGLLAGLRDRNVGRALALLHEQPMRDWSVDTLAAQAGVSRSVLTQRFTSLVGQPPMQYLKRWRLGLAAAALKENRRPIAALAGEYGYESEAGFSRAFKQAFGAPPAAWRRARAA